MIREGVTDYKWAVPTELDVPPDPLKLRLDFHHQAVSLTIFEEEAVTTKLVSALDVATALASDLSFGTGLLPPGTLWWQNTRGGPTYALYAEPKVRKVALLVKANEPPLRFTIPLPGFVFLCSPGQPPWVFAVKKKPTKETDIVYKAPLCNLYENGRSCSGSHRYPERVADIVQSFFMSFFTREADRHNRSEMFARDVVGLWEYLANKKTFPMRDLVRHGTIQDLMVMEKR